MVIYPLVRYPAVGQIGRGSAARIRSLRVLPREDHTDQESGFLQIIPSKIEGSWESRDLLEIARTNGFLQKWSGRQRG